MHLWKRLKVGKNCITGVELKLEKLFDSIYAEVDFATQINEANVNMDTTEDEESNCSAYAEETTPRSD